MYSLLKPNIDHRVGILMSRQDLVFHNIGFLLRVQFVPLNRLKPKRLGDRYPDFYMLFFFPHYGVIYVKEVLVYYNLGHSIE